MLAANQRTSQHPSALLKGLLVQTPKHHASIIINFGTLADHPISHDRIALFNSGLVTAATYRRDRAFFERTRPQHLRIDLGWGAEWMHWQNELATVGSDGSTIYDFAETDAIAAELNRTGTKPYWSYCYVPKALRPPGGDWRTMAEDDAPWVSMVRAYAAGAAARGVSIGYHEVYNEPDLRDERTGEPVFYSGNLDDYLQLYRQTSHALKQADSNALVGGPALGSTAANAFWLRAFLDMVTSENLPLDFLSFHHYGTHSLATALETVLSILAEYDGLDAVELHLNEYNSFPIDYPRGGLQDSYLLASAFVEDAARLLDTYRLTRVSWAQFLDSGNDNYSGMVDIDGAPKPLHSAYEFFQRMPVDRRTVSIDGPRGVGAIASSDGERGAAMVYNRSSEDVEITVSAPGGLAPQGVRMIDPTHDGEQTAPFRGGTLTVARGAVACIEYGSRTPSPGELSGTRAGRIVLRPRLDYAGWRADGVDGAWADVDEVDGTVRLGTGCAGVDGAATVRAGFDLPSSVVLEFSTSVTFADGSPADGAVAIETIRHEGFTTVWTTLTGAPAGAFATARLAATGSGSVR